jgi:Flp pilus assembly protein TadG
MTRARPRWHRLAHEDVGATTVEFTIICLVVIVVLLGILDMARFAWEYNSAKAAARAGVRYAAVHPPAVSGLVNLDTVTSCGLPGGDNVPTGTISDFTCTSTGANCTSSCPSGYSCSCTISTTRVAANFTNIVTYMQKYDPRISASNVVIQYKERGLGVSGVPNSIVPTDASPLITVSLQNISFKPMALRIIGVSFTMPTVSTTMTAEDLG